MISALVRRLRSLYWRAPYAQPEPLAPLPDIAARIAQARADVRDLTAAYDMKTGASR